VEFLIAVVVIGVLGAIPLALVLAFVATQRASRVERSIEELRSELSRLEARVIRGGASAASPAAAPGPTPPAQPIPMPAAFPTPAPAATASPPPGATTHEPLRGPTPPAAATPIPAATPVVDRTFAPSPMVAPIRSRPQTPRSPPPPPPDFATNLGPRILVGMGALAVVAFLGLFVRYAWENEWVGPTGRIVFGAVVSIALVATGLRLMDRELRPLGQGLAAIGLAGLYVCGFGAHAFYDLVPRSAAAVFMLAVTACGVALADRLDARLLATLAWIGGYLTPMLLHTGEDRAVSLYLYLLLLAAGALVLDHRKPWPETMPLAMVGTMVLYAGWYAQFFRPERFEVAAVGLVLFTGVFAFGMASKERGLGLFLVAIVAALGLAVLAAGADRPAILLALSLGLAVLAARGAERFGTGMALAAAALVGLPFLVWTAAHYRSGHFGVAAAWLVGGTLLFVIGLSEETSLSGLLPAAILVAGGLASVVLAGQTDRPLGILILLTAQAALAALLRPRWSWSEAAGVTTAALAVMAWFARFYDVGREGDVWRLTLGVAALYLLLLVGRSLVGVSSLGVGSVVAHLVNAGFLWTMLYRVLYDTQPSLLGQLSVALAAHYLAWGLLALRQRPEDVLQVRTLLGLAAGFLTLAIPVQLGLHGITLGWAVEGLLLLSLGRRFQSELTRAAGFAVLALAVVRLFARHVPLHQGSFRPFLNPSFGTWLFVIAALGIAVILVRSSRADLDRVFSPILAVLAIVLLFGLLTDETRDTFVARAAALEQAGEPEAARAAQREGGLALSVLWTTFATGLLGFGLLLRSRPLFYGGYGLFAFTAAKVMLVDLATFAPLYRMLSLLALGILLLAGAWLNLRFRERLLPSPETS